MLPYIIYFSKLLYKPSDNIICAWYSIVPGYFQFLFCCLTCLCILLLLWMERLNIHRERDPESPEKPSSFSSYCDVHGDDPLYFIEFDLPLYYANKWTSGRIRDRPREFNQDIWSGRRQNHVGNNLSCFYWCNKRHDPCGAEGSQCYERGLPTF